MGIYLILLVFSIILTLIGVGFGIIKALNSLKKPPSSNAPEEDSCGEKRDSFGVYYRKVQLRPIIEEYASLMGYHSNTLEGRYILFQGNGSKISHVINGKKVEADEIVDISHIRAKLTQAKRIKDSLLLQIERLKVVNQTSTEQKEK
jgi:hypothetical protein